MGPTYLYCTIMMNQDETTTLMSDTMTDSSSALLGGLPSPASQQEKQGGRKSGHRRRPFVLLVGVFFCLVAVIVLKAKKKEALDELRSLTGTGGTLRRSYYQAPITPLPTPSSAFAGANNSHVNNRNSQFIMPGSTDARARKADARALPTQMSGNVPAHSRTSPGTRTAQHRGWTRSSAF